MASFDHSRAAGPRPPTGPAGRSEATADPPGGSNGNVVPVTTTSTLSVDCGGGGIKASVLDAEGAIVSRAVRTPTPYPLPPSSSRRSRVWPSSCPEPTASQWACPG